jgi:hypothetical protein
MALRASLRYIALGAPCLVLTAAAQPANPASAPASSGRIAATLQPSVQLVKAALATVNIDKWKASSAIKSEADSNLNSVQRDMDQTLPGLVMAADAAPDSAAKVLPVYRNVDALYDVMLRLDAAGRLAAPKDQIGALDDALASIATARRTLGDQLQASADAQEQRMIRLQQAAARPAPAPAPAPVACTPPPAPATTRKKRSATTTKSASSTPKPADTATH